MTYNQVVIGNVTYTINGLPVPAGLTTGTGTTRTIAAANYTLEYETPYNITFNLAAAFDR